MNQQKSPNHHICKFVQANNLSLIKTAIVVVLFFSNYFSYSELYSANEQFSDKLRMVGESKNGKRVGLWKSYRDDCKRLYKLW